MDKLAPRGPLDPRTMSRGQNPGHVERLLTFSHSISTLSHSSIICGVQILVYHSTSLSTMADKISTLILTVDLECRRCYKKIRRVIAQFPEIQSQIFEETNNKVIVSGHFDPEKLSRKLCCKACKYIIDIQIKLPDTTKPPGPTTTPATPSKQDSPPSKQDSPQSKPDTKPALPPPEPVLPVPGILVGPYAPMVCCRPCYEGYPEHGICTRFGYERGTCTYIFFSEEDPSCSIM
ncbi:protein PYRICULARIA ORYZAE RESISTANCE 21-like protein [Cinnamomum micranthum f. kanehirae]|uniref:Protein PYRICULARIA ORYZAE RESISTANCE 21-like protein n=1 Tax=Cinnamomum micranthum f. kanehirae TaxID=337451 RepID=A0A3S3M4X0_9MAGN|nr:protein PYRICULARIA ORYZAE RESISTANCE 21-like protein [Cinnamomum micranthum f. kanehirae]